MRCHRKSNQAMSPEVAGCLRSTLAAVPFKAATQHPGSSSPPSLLRWGCCSRMCIASFSSSSLLVLAWSITVASSHLIGWLGDSHIPPSRQDGLACEELQALCGGDDRPESWGGWDAGQLWRVLPVHQRPDWRSSSGHSWQTARGWSADEQDHSFSWQGRRAAWGMLEVNLLLLRGRILWATGRCSNGFPCLCSCGEPVHGVLWGTGTQVCTFQTPALEEVRGWHLLHREEGHSGRTPEPPQQCATLHQVHRGSRKRRKPPLSRHPAPEERWW